jgi:hypothetical protein
MVVLIMFSDMVRWYADHFSVIFNCFYEHQTVSFVLLPAVIYVYVKAHG